MIVTKTPLRISFLGGGTDYPDHFRRFGGRTLGVAIDSYSRVIVERVVNGSGYSVRFGDCHTERVAAIDQIQHRVVRECLRFLGISFRLSIQVGVDLPAGTGLGSSSSTTVGLLHALHTLKEEQVSPVRLAAEAVYVEQELIGERVGVQDQYICAHGGLVYLQCALDGTIKVSPLSLPEKRLLELRSHLMLFDTGLRRHAHAVLDEQIERTKAGAISQELAWLSEMVEKGLSVLTSDEPISRFGHLLHAAWAIKRRLSSKISNGSIDHWYARARQAGAIGGKLLGAGGGGFLLLFVEPQQQPAVERALDSLRRVDVGFDDRGSVVHRACRLAAGQEAERP